MNKFKNSYELIVDLVRNNLLSGFYLSSAPMYFDLDLQTKIEDTKLLKHIENICNSWMLENAKNEGFYNFIFEKNGELILDVSTHNNLLNNYGNPFDLQEIFSIFLNVLNINSFDKEEWFENFLELTINFERANNNCVLEEFKFELIDEEYISKKEFDYLKNNLSIELKKSLEVYFIENININNYGISDFSISIQQNNFNSIVVSNKIKYRIKDFFINDNVSFSI
ncbi:MAG: hypothetical protein RLZZ323_1204 [Bacteroidota bacterium]|jgi:hypothetical protein